MTSHPLLSAAELAGASAAIVLDARDRSAYDAGHWPGAFHLDIKRWESLARTAEGGLQHAEFWAAQIGALGIDGRRPVVVHDDGRMTEAARAWFILQWHGADARVLDGGWAALIGQLNVAPDRTPSSPNAVVFRRPDGYEPRVRLIQRDELRERLDAGLQVLDARTRAERDGVDLRANARGGHLPGSKWVPHAELLQADGTLKSAPELRSQISAAGLDPEAPVVTHCDAGGRAALAALAAVVAGQTEVHAYYLSFSDWAADASCPITKP